jgi:hypothetical protein
MFSASNTVPLNGLFVGMEKLTLAFDNSLFEDNICI